MVSNFVTPDWFESHEVPLSDGPFRVRRARRAVRLRGPAHLAGTTDSWRLVDAEVPGGEDQTRR